MSICCGDLAKATFEGQPAVNVGNGDSVRKFSCKEYPRLTYIETRTVNFKQSAVFYVDDEPCTGLTDAIARLNEHVRAGTPRAPVDMSAQVRRLA